MTVQAYGLRLLQIERAYLAPAPDAARKVAALLATCDRFLFAPELGLRLMHPPIANDARAQRLVGRMGIVPAG